MEFSLREWLILVGVIIIIGVLLDGYRRVRKNRRGSLKLAIDKNLKFKEGDKIDFYNGELPNGAARIVTRSSQDTSSNPSENQEVLETSEISETENNQAADTYSSTDDTPETDDLLPDPLFAGDEESSSLAEEDIVPAIEEPSPEPFVQEKLETAAEQVGSEQSSRAGSKSENPLKEVEEVIVISVFASEEPGFENSDIMRIILACGMRYGDMDIFHRNERDDGKGAVQFSMANAVKPGTFDLSNMDGVYTPGITFFLSLPGPEDSIKAFDYMLETAQCVAKNLNGSLKDDRHSDMTAQTIEHARHRVQDFERRQLSLLR